MRTETCTNVYSFIVRLVTVGYETRTYILSAACHLQTVIRVISINCSSFPHVLDIINNLVQVVDLEHYETERETLTSVQSTMSACV